MEESTPCKCGASPDKKATTLATRRPESPRGMTTNKLKGVMSDELKRATCRKRKWERRKEKSYVKSENTMRAGKLKKRVFFKKALLLITVDHKTIIICKTVNEGSP